MTQRTKAAFEAILEDGITAKSDSFNKYYKEEVMNCMRRAYNLALIHAINVAKIKKKTVGGGRLTTIDRQSILDLKIT